MLKCKRCHAPDERNAIGLCPHCMRYIKDDIKKSKARLDELYHLFPESLDGMEEEQQEAYLAETQAIFLRMEDYHRYGCIADDYIVPVKKILYFLDKDKRVTAKLFQKVRMRKVKSMLFTSGIAAALMVCVLVIYNTARDTPPAPDEAMLVNGGIDSGSGMEGFPMDSGELDSGVLDSGVLDSGVIDSEILDSGEEPVGTGTGTARRSSRRRSGGGGGTAVVSIGGGGMVVLG